MSVMRSVLIALSHNKVLQGSIMRVPAARRMARRFVSGETLADAIAAVQALDAQGLLATLDHLGENVTDEPEASAAADEYLAALEAIHAADAQTNISVKLTQMGLALSDELCYRNTDRIVRRAAELGNFVRIDMEGSPYTARTLALYRRLRQRHANVGVVVQAYLHRTQSDVEALIAEGCGHFRLCKGAYDEPADIAYHAPQRVTQALNALVRTCLEPAARARGAYAAVASHDEEVINFTRAYAHGHDIPADAYEFQMLYGVRRELQARLVRLGHRVRIYVPYGAHWYPYYMRRLAERPANLLFFLRAFVGN